MSGLATRVIGALKCDAATYRELAAAPSATWPALAVVILTPIVTAAAAAIQMSGRSGRSAPPGDQTISAMRDATLRLMTDETLVFTAVGWLVGAGAVFVLGRVVGGWGGSCRCPSRSVWRFASA